MQDDKITIFCHIENGNNTIVNEPKFLLMAVETKIYSITKSLSMNLWASSFGNSEEKRLTSQQLLVRAGNSKTNFFEMATLGANYEINNVLKCYWRYKPSNDNDGKFYLVSDLLNGQNLYLLFRRQIHESGLSIYMDSNYSPSLTFDQANASLWEFEYYPSSSNNTYLISTVDPNYPKMKLYLKLDCSYEIPKLTLWSFIENGSIWGLSSAI